MIRRLFKNLALMDPSASPSCAVALERDGFVKVPAVLNVDEVVQLRNEIEAVFVDRDPGRARSDREEFRYEMLNHSAACQVAVAHPRVLEVIEPLLGDDCHVIANTAWRNPPTFPGGPWHCDAGPHVPRAEGVPWDERIPYPIFAIGAHLYLQDCTMVDGPTAVVPGSHRSGRLPPFDAAANVRLAYEGDGRPAVAIEANAGDVVLFVSDAWHRGLPAGEGATGRFFLQVHYGRRDIAQRVRTSAEANQLSPDAIARANTPRAKTIVGLHDPYFYDG